MKKIFFSVFALMLSFLTLSSQVYGYDLDGIKNTVKETESIVYDTETFEILPYEVKQHINDNSDFDQLISAVATIHVIESNNGEIKKIDEIDFDFRYSDTSVALI